MYLSAYEEHICKRLTLKAYRSDEHVHYEPKHLKCNKLLIR